MRTLVVGDLHLTRHSAAKVEHALTALLDEHAGARFVFAGDFFDVVTDDPTAPQERAVQAILGKHTEATAALRRALDRGSELVFISGNHDAEVGHQQLKGTLAEMLAETAAVRQRLTVSPWFWRHGPLHVEHGHLYDPDNAPHHPLIAGEPSLGVHFSAGFMHPTQAYRYLQTNDKMPLEMLLSAFSWYGTRAPYVIYRYFHTAFSALARSGPFYRATAEGQLGEGQKARFAEDAGVPRELIDAILAARAEPTLQSWSNTFARLYLDRALATLLCGSGIATTLSGRPAVGLPLAGLGAMLLTLSWAHRRDRYQGGVVEQLEQAAARIVETTDAKLVVFGHAHREALTDHYANTASFAFPCEGPGHPFVEIVTTPHGVRAERRYQL